MNKDFWKQPISLKDIKIKKINLKDIKNKKEILIGILIFAFVVSILVIGHNLLKTRSQTNDEYNRKKSIYSSLQNSAGEDQIKKMIEEAGLEKDELSAKLVEINNTNEFYDIFNDFKKNAPIKWTKEDINPKFGKANEEYDVYIATINSFSGNFDQIQEFLEYVKNYDKLVRVDTLSFGKDNITGKITGKLRLSFYFKKLSE